MSTIHQDVANDTNEDGINAEDAFSKLWGLDAEKPSKDTDDEENEEEDDQEKPDNDADNDDGAEGDDEGSDESPDADDDEDGDDEQAPTVEIKDDHKFKFTENGEEREVTLGQLKRLAGQEAALTRKSQEVATTRKALDAQNAAILKRSATALERARAKYEPLSKIDLLAASKDPNVSKEELIAARNAIQAAHDEVAFFEADLAETVKDVQAAQNEALKAEAQEAIKVLTDPEKGIEGFNEQMYGEIRSFALNEGLPAEVVNALFNPAAIKLINMARLYVKGKTAVQTAKPDKKKAPKRIVKGTASAETSANHKKTVKATEPMKRLKKSGSTDDAADAFMARWSRSDD